MAKTAPRVKPSSFCSSSSSSSSSSASSSSSSPSHTDDESNEIYVKVTQKTQPKLEKQSSGYRPDIDGLRAVAVLAVFIYHMDARWLPGGFVGVDIFFVISGYVVAGSLLRCQMPDITAYFVNFYARRMKRLTPALVVVTVLAGFVGAVILPPWSPETEEFYKAGMLGLIGWSNNHFAMGWSKVGYFEAMGEKKASRNPFLHTWSLGVEEQFYLTFPAILVLAHGQRVAKSLNWKPEWPTSSAILGSGIALSLLISIPLTIWQKEFSFYTLPSRYWELAVGALTFNLEAFAPWPHASDWGFMVTVGVQVMAVLCTVLALLFTPEGAGFPFPCALLPAVGATCFIIAGSGPTSCINQLLGHKWPVYIGKLSYPIYLWHWPVIVFTDALFGNLRSKLTYEMVGYRMFQVVVVAVGAIVTYHWVEGAFRNWKPSMPWKIFFVLVPFILAAEVWLGLLGGPLNGSLFLAQPTSRGCSLSVTGKDHANHSVNHIDAYLATDNIVCEQCRCCLQDTTFHIPPGAEYCFLTSQRPCFVEQQNYDHDFFFLGDWASKCFSLDQDLTSWPIETCLTPNRGPNGKKPAVFLFGDSHAQMFVPALKHAVSRDYSLVWATRPGKSDADTGLKYLDCYLDDSEVHCRRVRDHIAMLLKPGDIVAIGYASYKMTQEFADSGGPPRGSLNDMHKYIELIHRWSDETKKHGSSVLVLGDPGVLKSKGLDCIPTAINPRAGAQCVRTRKWSTAYDRNFKATLRELLDKVVSNAYFFDSRDLFCDDSTCSAMIPGTCTLAIGDWEHLTIEGSKYLWPFLCSFLSKQGLLPYRMLDDDVA